MIKVSLKDKELEEREDVKQWLKAVEEKVEEETMQGLVNLFIFGNTHPELNKD